MTGLSLQPPTRSVMLPSRPRLLSLLTLVFALLSATVAIAQPDPRVEARAHYQAGVAVHLPSTTRRSPSSAQRSSSRRRR
jgi:hypothetical protein